MHEMGIITHLAKTLDETAKEQNIKKITKVTIQVGEVSGIMTNLFNDCYNYFKVKNPVIASSELVIEPIRAITFCDSCKKEYSTIKYGRQCPYCDSFETYLIKGNECIIKEIEIDET